MDRRGHRRSPDEPAHTAEPTDFEVVIAKLRAENDALRRTAQESKSLSKALNSENLKLKLRYQELKEDFLSVEEERNMFRGRSERRLPKTRRVRVSCRSPALVDANNRVSALRRRDYAWR